MANCTNLKLIDGGSEIKQGDFSSAFCFQFLDENKKIIKGLDEKNAVVVLKIDDAVLFEKSVVVKDNAVKFTIDKTLNAGVYVLEIFCDGYVFQSTDSFRITVIKSAFKDEDLRGLIPEKVEKEVETESAVDFDVGTVIVLRHDPNGNVKGRFTVRATNSVTGEVIEKSIEIVEN